MRGHLADGEFASGSMGPKVEAICRFVEQSGRPGVIANLRHIVAAASLGAGTVVVSDADREDDSTDA
jgi:carbamate kinase